MVAFESIAVPEFGAWRKGLTDQARIERENQAAANHCRREDAQPGTAARPRYYNLIT